MIGEKATLFAVIMMDVEGLFRARTTFGAGTYTKSGGTIVGEVLILWEGLLEVWEEMFGKTKWKG